MKLAAIGLFAGTLAFCQAGQDSWTSYANTTLGWRFSDFSEINTSTVSRLVPKWLYQTNVSGKNETSPLVVGGVMYFTGPLNYAWAVDLLTGRPLWTYKRTPPPNVSLCCGPVNRGFAIHGKTLFKADLQGALVALDANSGSVVWEATLADYKKGYSATAAPLVVKNMVVTGMAGAEFGTRGFIDAYDVTSGKRIWRVNTVAAKGEPNGETWAGDSAERGGGSTWVTGSYDPELNLIYWGTGNPGPDMDGSGRLGENLYTCSLIAVDADTGKIKWHYQFTPHDEHDWDAIGDIVVMTLTIGGHPVKAVVQANRNGFFYALNAATGKVLVAKPYTRVTWASGIDASGRPVIIPGQSPTEEGNRACPGMGGGHNWQATSFSPKTGLYYFTSTEKCMIFFKTKQAYVEGGWYQASTIGRDEAGTGRIDAINPATGELAWSHEMINSPTGGVLATAGSLVFVGDAEGYLTALEAKSGKVLWRFQTGATILAPPISYALNGHQYIAVAAGQTMIAFALPGF